MGVITLLTDFGTVDGYVGAMKGAIYEAWAGAVIVDLTHDVPPQDIAAGAFALATSAPLFPEGTVHVAVVDPGVGGVRRGVVVDDGRCLYVGPDNGIFSLAVPTPVAVHELTNPFFRRKTVSATFHGRDIFAPAAARLAAGAPPSDVGPAVTLEGTIAHKPVLHDMEAKRIVGSVVHIDRFGNLITNIPGDGIPPTARVGVGKTRIDKLSRCYEDVPRGRILAYVGSAGTIEIAVREGNAAKKLTIKRGTRVTVFLGKAR